MTDEFDVLCECLDKDCIRVVDDVLIVSRHFLLHDQILIKEEGLALFELLQEREDVVLADSAGVRQTATRKHELLVRFRAGIQELRDDVEKAVLASEGHSAERMELILDELEYSLADLAAIPLRKQGLEGAALEAGELDLRDCVLLAHALKECLHIGTVVETQLPRAVLPFENLLVGLMLIHSAGRLVLDLTLRRRSRLFKILVELSKLAVRIISDLLLDYFDLVRREFEI